MYIYIYIYTLVYVKVFLRIFTLRIFNHLITVVLCSANTVNKPYERNISPFCLISFRNVSLYFHPRRRYELSSILGVETYRIPIIPVYTVHTAILHGYPNVTMHIKLVWIAYKLPTYMDRHIIIIHTNFAVKQIV